MYNDYWEEKKKSYRNKIIACITVPILVIIVMLFLATFHWNAGEDVFTGYIYSTEDFLSNTTVHIRFSENAGTDEQPSFCVSEEDRKLVKELAGSGKKVRVTRAPMIRFEWPWKCGIPAKVEVVGGENEKTTK